MKKPLPVGVDNFERIITEDYYYVMLNIIYKKNPGFKGNSESFHASQEIWENAEFKYAEIFF